MDNARFYRIKGLRKPVGGKAWLLFSPMYSPDYNSVEKRWANLKHFLRSNPRDFQFVDMAVGDYYHIPVY
jgi:transposase